MTTVRSSGLVLIAMAGSLSMIILDQAVVTVGLPSGVDWSMPGLS